ncbi:unnamed protein product [Jaminaea pallidilutea]
MRENQYDTASVAPLRQRSHCGSAASATELPTYGFYDPTTKPRPSTEASPRPTMVRESPHSSPFIYTQHLQRRGDTEEEVEILATASSQSSSFALGLGPRAASSLGHVSSSIAHESLASRSSLQIDAQRSFSASGTAVGTVSVQDAAPAPVNESFPNAKARRLLGLDNGGWDDEDDEDDENEQNRFRAAWSANVKKRISVTAAKNSFNRRTSGSSNEEPLTEVNSKQAPRREEDVAGSNTVLLKVGKTIGINRAFRATNSNQEQAAVDRCQTPLSKSKSPVVLTPRKSTDRQYNANTPWTPPSSWALSLSPQMRPYGPTSPRTQKSQSFAMSPSTPSPTSRKKTKPRIDVYLRRIKGHRGSSDASAADPSALTPSSPSPSSTSVSQRDLMLWERTLDSAERSASWQTAIEHRPRARRPSTSSTSSASSSMRSHPMLLMGSSSTLDLAEDAKSSTDHASTVRRRRSGSTTKEVPARGSSLDSRIRRLPMAPYPFGPAVTADSASLRPHHHQEDALEMLDESATVLTRGVGALSSSTTGWTRSLSSDHAVPSAHSTKSHVPPPMVRGYSWDAKKPFVGSRSTSSNTSAPIDTLAVKAGQSPRRPRRPPQAPLLECHLQPPPSRPSNAANTLLSSSSSSSFSSSVGQQVIESPAESDWSRCPSLDQSPTTSESPAGTVASRSDEEWRMKRHRQWQEANETSPTPDHRPTVQKTLENLSLLGNVEESEEDQQWSKSGDIKDDACTGQRITFHAATPEVAGREPLSSSDSCFYFTADISDDSALPSSRDSGSYGLGIDAPTTTVTSASDLIERIERDIRANKVLSLGCERRLGQSLLSLPEDENDSEEQDDLMGGVIHFPQPPSSRVGHRENGVSYTADGKARFSVYDDRPRFAEENPEEAGDRKGEPADMLIILPPDAKLGTAPPAGDTS